LKRGTVALGGGVYRFGDVAVSASIPAAEVSAVTAAVLRRGELGVIDTVADVGDNGTACRNVGGAELGSTAIDIVGPARASLVAGRVVPVFVGTCNTVGGAGRGGLSRPSAYVTKAGFEGASEVDISGGGCARCCCCAKICESAASSRC
jgi:hypothetical protein